MVRPEHVRFTNLDHDAKSWNAIVRHVNYVGERYEALLELEDGNKWWAYHSERLAIGERASLYVSPNHISILKSREEKKS